MMKKLLLTTACALSMAVGGTMTAAAQADGFFNRELVVNGTAEEVGSDNLPVGWTMTEGAERAIVSLTYADEDLAGLAAEHEGTGTRLFTGGDGSFFGSSSASSYQVIEVTEDAWQAIDGDNASCTVSALLGGYGSQDDRATLTFTFLGADGGTLGETQLGPVTKDERGNGTAMFAKSATVQIPAGTRSIRVAMVSEKSSWGSAIDGYADNISLIAEMRDVRPQISTSASAVACGEEWTINYANTPAGAAIRLYKDAAMLPMKLGWTVGGEGNASNGKLTVDGSLEPGIYTIRCTNANGESLAEEVKVTVAARPYESGDKNILVMSDIHVMSPELLVSEGAAFDDYLASDRKLLVESEAILKTMVDTIIASRPELVLIPGDLTKDGELLSHRLVAGYLDEIRDAGIKVLVIPGNHDVNNPHALTYDGDKSDYAETVSKEEFAEIYADYGYGEGSVRDEASLSYATEPFEGLVVIGIDACKYEENKFISAGDDSDECVTSGRVKDETLRWISEQAKEANRHGKQVIAMMHHNLVEHFNSQASIAAPYVVDSAATVRKVLMEAGIRTVFTGHFHIQDIAMDYNEDKTDSIFDISTGSTVTYPCPFRRVKLNDDNTVMDITSATIRSIDTEDGKIEDFQSYAQVKLADGIAPMVTSLVHDYWDVINSTVDSLLGSSSLIQSIVTMPETPEEMSTLLIECLESPAIKAYLTFSESNEHLKATDEVFTEINAGVDKLVEKVVASWAVSIAQGLIDEKLNPMIDTIIGSIIGNVTNKGTDRENVKNDLFLTINLPKQTDTSGMTDMAVNADGLNVWPTMTDGWVTIQCPSLEEDADLLIFDMSGRIIHRRKLDASEGRQIHYHFDTSGIHAIKLTGHHNAVKVIVNK